MKAVRKEFDPKAPVCILRSEDGTENNAEVLTEAGTQNARVFTNVKAGKRWVRRNIISPAERAKLYFVQAPSVK